MITGAHKWLHLIAWLPVTSWRLSAVNFLFWPITCETFIVSGKGSVITVVDEVGRRWTTDLVCDDDWRKENG